MPKYRNLHLKIVDSFDFNEMPDDFTRVTWMLLTLIVDSEGRGIDNAAWIKSKMYPMREDVTDQAIKRAFDWFAARQMIVRYAAAGRSYFYIPSFKTYQSHLEREAKSLLPEPPAPNTNSRATHEELVSNSNPSVIVIESVGASVLGTNTPAPDEEPNEEESEITQLSKQFEASANMTAHNLEKWVNAITEMHRAGVKPDDLAHVVYTMKNPPKGGKKLVVAGPWSCVNMAIAYVADKKSGSTNSLGINRDDYVQ